MKVYVCQFDTATGINLLPLAAGMLVAKARSNPLINATASLRIVTERTDLQRTVETELRDATVIGYSCYMWNLEHSLAVARAAKVSNPRVFNVIGGPSAPRDTSRIAQFMAMHPQIDAIAIGEGEITFSDLLSALLDGSPLTEIPGLFVRDERGVSIPALPPRPRLDLRALPSPFLDGTFDALVAERRDAITGAVWETNRGCPFSCTFCDWGQVTSSKVMAQDLDRLEAELEWLAANKFDFVWATDANFGIKAQDVEIARRVAASRARTGYPSFFQVSWTKNSSRKVAQIYDVLDRAGIRSPVTLSVQSLDSATLRAVERTNISAQSYNDLKLHFGRLGIQSYTELILGLPGETYTSFTRGMIDSLSPFSTDFLVVYPCRLLENAEMASAASRTNHGIVSRLCALDIPRRKGRFTTVQEFEEIVVGTATMPEADWRRAYEFMALLCGLYNQGLLHFTMNVLKHVLALDVQAFVEDMQAQAARHSDSVLGRVLAQLHRHEASIFSGGPAVLEMPEFGEQAWEPQESCYLIAAHEPDAFLAEIAGLTRQFIDRQCIQVPPAFLEEMFAIQSALIPRFGAPRTTRRRFQWNWIEYLQTPHATAHVQRSREPSVLEFEQPDIREATLEEFLMEQVRVTRRGSRTLCSVKVGDESLGQAVSL